MTNMEVFLTTLIPMLSISDIERESGISRDTLRIWERRYGFPAPLRDQRSERLYTGEQLERLRIIKQLLDIGMRPGKLATLNLQQLRLLAQPPEKTIPLSLDVQSLLSCMTSGHCVKLPGKLKALHQQYGLRFFLTEVVAPLTKAVGEAWFDGRISIFDEHHYTEQIRMILSNALGAIPMQYTGSPKVLLTTMPGEQHGIGLLMAACLFALEGLEVLLLGVQTPLEDIARGAVENQCTIVGISCSTHINRRTIATQLVRLRKQLRTDIPIWVGGDGVAGLRTVLPGVQVFHDLKQIQTALNTLTNRSTSPRCYQAKQHTGT
jgi:methylmalonyl-CoA mutase cobalamin-binding subunit